MQTLKRFKNEFKTSIPPNHQKVCGSIDDYFDLIKYCWECIGDVKQAVVGINFYGRDSHVEFMEYKKMLCSLHARIEECYAYLNNLGKAVDISSTQDVYTTTKAHEGRKHG